MPHPSNPAGMVTVSIGVATLYPHLKTDAADIIAHADRALYSAKAGGRNRIAVARGAA
jgi:diguanylate cyclase (GGDEF)-like protein